MKELIGTTIYRKADGTETEAKIFFNGDGNNMTFEEDKNSHLICAKAQNIEMAKLIFNCDIKGQVLVN